MLYAADSWWWNFHAQAALKFEGLKVTCSDVPYRQVLKLFNSGDEGFDPLAGAIRTGGNSAYQAAHVAAHAGAAKILLLGVDAHAREGVHHHGEHPTGLRNPTRSTFDAMITKWRTLAGPLREIGIEVINCNPESAVDAFPKMPIEDALC